MDHFGNEGRAGHPPESDDPVVNTHAEVSRHAAAISKGIEITSEVAMYADVSGMGNATRAAINGDKGDIAISLALIRWEVLKVKSTTSQPIRILLVVLPVNLRRYLQ